MICLLLSEKIPKNRRRKAVRHSLLIKFNWGENSKQWNS